MSPRTAMLSVIVLALCVEFQVHAQKPAAKPSGPHFIVSGTSTVRSWSCPAEGVITITPGKSAPAVPGVPTGVGSVVLTVPVAAIACEDAQMSEHLRDALNAKVYPEIVYHLEKYALSGSEEATTTGTLTIAGVTQPISLDVKLVTSPEGTRAVGETSIDMTQFKVTPPDLWAGLLKVRKDVRVRFDAPLAQPQAARTSADGR